MTRKENRFIYIFEVAFVFLKMGFTSFGGPAAHIAMMRNELVSIRKWVTDQEFLDTVGAANLIPGPTSTEVAIFLAYHRAGLVGLLVGGMCFIVPSMFIVLFFAWFYVKYGSTPKVESYLYGIKPVVIAIIVIAIANLFRTAIKKWYYSFGSAAIIILYLYGVNPIFLLFGIGFIAMLLKNWEKFSSNLFLSAAPIVGPAYSQTGADILSLKTLFLMFLKTGAVIYGSGYVLIAFLRHDFVEVGGLLTEKQLIDAITVGQITPGPVFTTAAFVGYLLGGIKGGLVSTAGIFLPSFVFTALVFPFIPRVRSSLWMSPFLDGVNVAAIGLMAAVSFQLGKASIVDLFSISVFLISAIALFKLKINSAWLILCGGIAGALFY